MSKTENSETAWTPGPWVSTHSGPVMARYSQPFAIGQNSAPNLIAGCFGDVRGGVEVAEANARLIALSPEIFSELAEIVEEFGGSIDQYDKIGPDSTHRDGAEFLHASVLLDRRDLIERARRTLSKARP